MGHVVRKYKNAALLKAAFARLPFALDHIEVFPTDRGPEFDNSVIDAILDALASKDPSCARVPLR